MHNSLLLVLPSVEVQRYVFEHYNAAHWSAGFPQILEKHGFLAFDQADHDILERFEDLTAYDLVVVSWLPDALWTDSMQENLQRFPGGVFLEGPIPDGLWELAGLEIPEPGTLQQAAMRFPDVTTEEVLDRHYYDLRPTDNTAVAAKKIVTKTFRSNRWDFDFNPKALELEDWSRRIVQCIHVPLLNRLAARCLGPSLKENLFAVALHLLFIRKSGKLKEYERARLAQMIAFTRRELAERSAAESTEKPNANEKRLLASVCRLAAQVGIDLNNVKEDAEWRKAFRELRSLNFNTFEVIGLLVVEIEAGTMKLDEEELRTQIRKLDCFIDLDLEQRPCQVTIVSPHATRDVAIASLALRHLGETATADDLLETIVKRALDYEKGILAPVLCGERLAEDKKPGNPHHALVGMAFLAKLETLNEPSFAGERFHERYGRTYIAKWASSPLAIQRFTSCAPDAVVLVGLHDGPVIAPFGDHSDYRWVGAVQKKAVVTFTFQALATVVAYHAVEPLAQPFADCDGSTTTLLEPLIIMAIERAAGSSETPLLRVASWPAGYHYCLTVRHDVDRIPTAAHFDALLDFELTHQLGVSWYWIFNRLDDEKIHRQEEAGHEVGLHSIKHEKKKEEAATLAARLSQQPRLYGEFAHGGGGEYWLGHPTVEASHAAGFDYGEGNSMIFDYPYRWPCVSSDGEIHMVDLICLSHSVSMDKPMQPNGKFGFAIGRMKGMARNGDHLMILNHPDNYLENLRRVIEHELPTDGRLDWTCKEVADWWRATHCAEEVNIECGRHGIFLKPRHAAHDVVIEVAGLTPSTALPEGFREIEQIQSHGGLSYRRFVTGFLDKNGSGAGQCRTMPRRTGRLNRQGE